MVLALREIQEKGNGKRAPGGGFDRIPELSAPPLAEVGNPRGTCARAGARAFREVLRQVGVEKRRQEPPKTAAKKPSGCLK